MADIMNNQPVALCVAIFGERETLYDAEAVLLIFELCISGRVTRAEERGGP